MCVSNLTFVSLSLKIVSISGKNSLIGDRSCSKQHAIAAETEPQSRDDSKLFHRRAEKRQLKPKSNYQYSTLHTIDSHESRACFISDLWHETYNWAALFVYTSPRRIGSNLNKNKTGLKFSQDLLISVWKNFQILHSNYTKVPKSEQNNNMNLCSRYKLRAT